ncbi:MAG: hypothetical protein D6769_00480 [Methanobacteriota archaeon]|nr:MAG: hypothetical protein D6769_00480 [Euryarchaeota archaeon]
MGYVFSPSTLSLLDECERCFYLHFNKGIKRPASIFPSLPSGMDSLLKKHFDSYARKGGLPPELAELDGKAELFGNMELLEEWRNPWKGLRWKDGNGNTLMGAIDNLLLINGLHVVLDYKTRGYPIKDTTASYYSQQLEIYAFLLSRLGYRTANYAYLLFYHPKAVQENGDFVFHHDLVKVSLDISNVERLLNRALDVLSHSMPEPSADCPYCSWRAKVDAVI